MLLVGFYEDFIPEIVIDLIDEKGKMTPKMLEVHDAIERGQTIIDDIPEAALAWIQYNINRTTIKTT